MNTMDTQNLNLAWNRKFVLAKMEGKESKSSSGMLDPRLFNGENNLIGVKDIETCLWTLKYERGILPGALKQTFTSFRMLHKFVEEYFKKRNIIIKEVID